MTGLAFSVNSKSRKSFAAVFCGRIGRAQTNCEAVEFREEGHNVFANHRDGEKNGDMLLPSRADAEAQEMT